MCYHSPMTTGGESPKQTVSFFALPFQRAGVVVLLALALYLIALSLNAFKQFAFIGADIPPLATVTVQGEGKAVVVPDTARFTFAVAAEAETAAEAQEAMTRSLNAVMAYLRDELGIPSRDIKTLSYTLTPRYEWRSRDQRCLGAIPCPPLPDRRRELVGFEARTSVQAKTKDFDLARRAVGNLAAKGATSISEVSFVVEHPEEFAAQARTEAIEQAKERAQAIARALGVSLGRVVRYEEGGNRPVPIFQVQREEAAGAGEAPVPDLTPGETTIQRQVTITYELR